MSQCLKSFMRKATLKVNIVISLVLRREELKLRMVDQLTESHTAQKQEKVAFHCFCRTDVSKKQMSEQHHGPFKH